jgi:hypothetical protein
MKRLFIASCVTVAFALGLVFVISAPPSPADVTAAARLDRYPLDVERSYALRWSQSQSTLLPTGEGVASAELELQGHFTLTGRSLEDGTRAVLLRLDEVQQYRATALSQPLPGEGLQGAECLALLEPTGGLKELRFSDSQSVMARYLLQGLAAEVFTVTPDEPTLEAKEQLPIGDMVTAFAWNAGRTTLSRTRARFLKWRLSASTPANVTVSDSAELYFEPAGPLRDVDGREHIEGHDAQGRPQAQRESSLTVRFTGQRVVPAQPQMLAARPLVRLPGTVVSEIDMRKALLENLVGKLTFEQVAAALRDLQDPRILSDRGEFVSRTAALLRLHPERCAELVPLFDAAKSDQMRAQILDILASAGSAEAQAAMRRMLELPNSTRDPKIFQQLYPRLGLAGTPTPETVKYVLDGHAAALHAGDVQGRQLRAYTLGTLASRTKDPQAAALMVDVLVDDVTNAADSRDLRHAYRALGNTGDPRALEVVREGLSSKDTDVRASAAVALRRVPGAEAQKTLSSLLAGETDRDVQRALLDALKSRPLSSESLTALRALTVERRLAPGAANELLALVGEQTTATPELVQTLQALLLMPNVSPNARQQARALLAKLAT